MEHHTPVTTCGNPRPSSWWVMRTTALQCVPTWTDSITGGIGLDGVPNPGTGRNESGEALYQAIFQQLAVGIIRIGHDGTVLEVNEMLCRIVGYRPEELIGRPVDDLTYPDDQGSEPAHPLLTDTHFASGIECRLQQREGQSVWVRLTMTPLRYAGGENEHVIIVEDISAQKRARALLEESEEHFRTIVERAPIGICVITSQGIFEQVNPVYAERLGYKPAELLGKHFGLVVPQDQLAKVATIRRQRHMMHEEGVDEFVLLTKDGRRVTVLELTVDLPTSGPVTRRMSFAVDISQRKEAETLLRHLAQHDPLTGLPNRAFLLEQARHILAAARRKGEVAAVLFVDLDGFKAVNDELGHDAGDAVLTTVAKRLVASTRESDVVARLGGDEFIVLLTNVGSARNTALVAQKMLDALAHPLLIAGHPASIGASIGIGLCPFDGMDVERLVACADGAMYEAKRGGKHRYAFATGGFEV